MSKKWDAIRGSAEFYVTMAVCLLVIGVSGYFLLFGGDDTAEEALAPTDETPVTSPAPELVVPEEPVVETIEPVEVPAATMPEVEVDDTPVIAQAPRLIVSPLEGEVLTAFSMDELVYNPTLEDWRTHNGIDISAALGDKMCIRDRAGCFSARRPRGFRKLSGRGSGTAASGCPWWTQPAA